MGNANIKAGVKITILSGLDKLLAKSLHYVIEKNLGKKTIQRVERRLFEKYGVSLLQSIEQFQKLDAVLRELFGAGTDALEKKFFNVVCLTPKSITKNQNWLTINDSSLAHLILEAYGDEDEVKILKSVVEKPMIVYDILKKSKLPQTSGYRKVKVLIETGLLIAKGSAIADDGRKITKYQSLFDNVRINIVKDTITVDVQLNEQNLNQSSIMQVIYGL